MKKEQIKYSIETGEMKLDNWDIITHYGIVGFLFIIPTTLIFLHIISVFDGESKPFREGEIWFIIITTILGLFF